MPRLETTRTHIQHISHTDNFTPVKTSPIAELAGDDGGAGRRAGVAVAGGIGYRGARSSFMCHNPTVLMSAASS